MKEKEKDSYYKFWKTVSILGNPPSSNWGLNRSARLHKRNPVAWVNNKPSKTIPTR